MYSCARVCFFFFLLPASFPPLFLTRAAFNSRRARACDLHIAPPFPSSFALLLGASRVKMCPPPQNILLARSFFDSLAPSPHFSPDNNRARSSPGPLLALYIHTRGCLRARKGNEEEGVF
jgi:hypothetical protein